MVESVGNPERIPVQGRDAVGETILVAQTDTGATQTPPDETQPGEQPAAQASETVSAEPGRTAIEVEDGAFLRLPEGASVDQPRVNGTDLEFVQADGSIIVVPNGAITGLTIFIGDVEIPAQTVATLFEANGIETAAGPAGNAGARGSGGNFEVPVGGIGDAFDIGDLLPPTALSFGANTDEPLYEGLIIGSPIAGANAALLLNDDDLSGGNAGGLGDDPSGPLSGILAHDYGPNGVGSVLFTGATFPAGLGFAASVSGDGLVLTIAQNGVAVMRLTLSDTQSGAFTIEHLASVSHPTNDAVEDNVIFDLTYRVTDSDGDFVDGVVGVNVDDDVPGTMTAEADAVIEDEKDSDGIDEADGGVGSVSGNVSDNGNWGADGFGSITKITIGLTEVAVPAGATGVTVYFAQNGSFQGTTSDGTTAASLLVKADGSYTYTLIKNFLLGVGTAGEQTNDVATVTFTGVDGDGDEATIALALKDTDDVPGTISKTDLFFSNSGAVSGTGVFDYSVGADQNLPYSNTSSDFSAIMLTGTVGGQAITGTSVTWASESSTQAIFNVAFSYGSGSASTDATGTLVFDKANGTYSVDLVDPISSVTVLTTSTATSFTGYNSDGTLDTNGPANIFVVQLDNDFYIRFSAEKPTTGNGATPLTATGAPTGSATAYSEGDLFHAADTDVFANSGAIGVGSQTIQRGEIVDMDFYSSDPGPTGTAPIASATSVYFKVEQLGAGEDFVVVLKLVDPDTNAITTRAVVVEYGDIYLNSGSNPYNIVYGTADGVVIIESNDYNINPGDNYLITGMQLLTSTEAITGSGINLNRDTGDTGGSSGTQAFAGDNDIIKFSDIGFVTTSTTAQDADLQFSFTVRDADGDQTTTQNLNVHVVNGQTFTGTTDNESLQGSGESDTISALGGDDFLSGGDGDDILIGGLGRDVLSGGGGNDTFKFGSGDFGTNNVDTITDFVFGDVIDLSDLLPGPTGNQADVQFKYSDGSTRAIGAAGGGEEGDVTVQVNNGGVWHDVVVIKDTGPNLTASGDTIKFIFDDDLTVVNITI